MLEASYQQDPVKDKFDYFGEIAWRYEMAGQPDRELAALKQYYEAQAGDLTANEDAADRSLSGIALRKQSPANEPGL